MLLYLVRVNIYHAGLILAFSQSMYNTTEDNTDGDIGSIVHVCVVMVSNIEIGREFSFYVSADDSTAIGN